MDRKVASFLAAAMIAAPTAAHAHLVVSGMGPVYDGIIHFGLSPEDVLPVIALGLFAGLRGPAIARGLLAALPLAWFIGGLIAFWAPAPPAQILSIDAALAFLGIGALLATNADLRPALCIVVGVVVGLLRGAADLAGAAASLPHAISLLGMSASVFVVFAIAASVTLPLKRLWMIVAARVGGSWLAALGLLLAGWVWRYGARIG